MVDGALQFTPSRAAELQAMLAESKFLPDPDIQYSGAPGEQVRSRCESQINALITRLLNVLASTPTKAAVLDQFRLALKHFEGSDTEERERACLYLERIMDILAIDSSDGLLNIWLYGFDPTTIQRDA